MSLLEQIESPADLRALPVDRLPALADEIRQRILDVVGKRVRYQIACRQLIDCTGGADVVGMLGLGRFPETTETSTADHTCGIHYRPPCRLRLFCFNRRRGKIARIRQLLSAVRWIG